MRTTLMIDDALIDQAREMTGIQETTTLEREGLLALISKEVAERLAALGGTQKGLRDVARRRSAL